ncbi:hypothetical protein PF004_g11512 [Phytophthora fragariae]|uniref:Uncharacterized protein n=1 Tax=Phytophthora fragariae TaxID=53985 RepID=A0A6G0NXX1_9STRA|nr:hypothetical protein PF003_g20100 [Phytophthora fragariae]KAE9226900.1 hypothetical protein PF004_g11512 [Phytophthora fragariae]
MPRRVSWRKKAVRVNAAEGEELHKRCATAFLCAAPCVWRGKWRRKIVTCLESEDVSIFEFGDHNTLASSPRRKKLTTTQKAFCREVAENHLRSIRAVEPRVAQRAGNTG